MTTWDDYYAMQRALGRTEDEAERARIVRRLIAMAADITSREAQQPPHLRFVACIDRDDVDERKRA